MNLKAATSYHLARNQDPQSSHLEITECCQVPGELGSGPFSSHTIGKINLDCSLMLGTLKILHIFINYGKLEVISMYNYFEDMM